MKLQSMNKRFAAILCAVVLLATLLPQTARAGTAGLPKDWWSHWGPYSEAVTDGKDVEKIIRLGSDVESYYSRYALNADIADHLVRIYDTRLDLLYYENKGDYKSALENTKKLLSTAEYLVKSGVTAYQDSVNEAKAHLDVIEPFAGVYAASYTQSNRYGSKIAPASGTLYGSVYDGYLGQSGRGSIVSVYVELEKESVEPQDYALSRFDDGNHVVEINLNFTKHGETARRIVQGSLDGNLDATFACLAAHSFPMVLRIGGEMNIWGDAKTKGAEYVSPADFIKAYRYVADKARAACPGAELVWSPMYSTRWGESYADFYPGDNYVDWVGMSLYFNYADKGYTARDWLEHNRQHRFADPLLCAKNLAAFAAEHKKPLIATEGGAYKNGPMGEAYAAAQNAKEFAVVNMVFPAFKALVYFDKSIAESDGIHDYLMEGSFRSAALSAIEQNPALISAGETQAATYVPLEQFSEKAERLVLGATGYTYNDADMKVSYTLDGAALSADGGPAHRAVIESSKLTRGAHILRVAFSDSKGYSVSYEYRIHCANDGTISCARNVNPFNDIARHWGRERILDANDARLMNGMGDGSFAPNGKLAVSQVLRIAADEHAKANGQSVPNAGGVWYQKYYDYCAANGIISAAEFPLSDVTRNASRYEMLAILDRALSESRLEPQVTVEEGFVPDVPESDPYHDLVYRWYRAGIIAGNDDHSFTGARDISRAEVATILCRLYGL